MSSLQHVLVEAAQHLVVGQQGLDSDIRDGSQVVLHAADEPPGGLIGHLEYKPDTRDFGRPHLETWRDA